jgi:hypothetical protein
MRPVLKIAMVMAAVGAVISVGIHIAAVFGYLVPPPVIMGLLGGVTILALPYFLVVKKLMREQKATYLLPVGALFRACPRQIKRVGYALFVYFAIVMSVFLIKANIGPKENWAQSQGEFLFFSSGGMISYFLLFEVFFSALKTHTRPWRCQNGHDVPPGHGYCEECGALVVTPKHKN